MEKLNNLKRMEPRKGYLFTYFSICLLALASFSYVLFSHYTLGWNPLIIGLTIVLMAAGFAMMGLFFPNVRRSPEKLFVVVGIPLVLGFAFLMMLFAIPDEYTHINRIFDNRTVDVLSVPAQLPLENTWVDGYALTFSWLTTPFDFDTLKETDYAAPFYTTINYLVPATIVSCGKLLGINGFALIFVARIANGCLFLVAGWWAIKTLPFGKTFALVFLLNPLLLQQEASCSADSLCNIAVICFVAQFLKMMRTSKEDMVLRDWILLFAFMALIAVCKYIYCMLALAAVLLIPKIKTRAIRIALPWTIAALVVAFVFLVATVYADRVDRLLAYDQLAFFPATAATFWELGLFHLMQFMGGNLGWPFMNDNAVPSTVLVPVCWIIYTVVYVAAFAASSLQEGNPLSRGARIVIAVLAFLCGLATFWSMWAGMPTAVTWYQSRYLLPPALFGAFALMMKDRWNIAGKIPLWAFAFACFLINCASLCYVMKEFWF